MEKVTQHMMYDKHTQIETKGTKKRDPNHTVLAD